MVYISNGKVAEKPTGVVALVKGYIFALINFIIFFLQSIISSEAASKHNIPDRRRPGDGPGGPGRGPRITDITKISGSSHAAQCGGGG